MTSSGVPVGDTTLLARLRERAERVRTAHDEMDRLHKSMYARDDSGVADVEMKFRADGLCLGLADSALMFADALPAVVTLIEQAEKVERVIRTCAVEDLGVDADDMGAWAMLLRAALAPFVGEAT